MVIVYHIRTCRDRASRRGPEGAGVSTIHMSTASEKPVADPGGAVSKPGRHQSIGFKLALFVSCLLILTAVVMNAVAFAVARRIVRAEIHERLRVTAADRHKMTMSFVGQQHERVALVASRTQLRRLIEEYVDGRRDLKSMQEMTRPILSDAQESSKGEFYAIWVCDSDGQVITATDDSLPGRDYSGDPHFQQGRLREHLSAPELVDGNYRAYLSAPARTNNDRPLGVVMVQLDAKPLVEILTDVDGLGETGEVLVASQDGQRVRYLLPPRHGGDPNTALSSVPAMAEAIAGKTSTDITETEYDGVSVLAQFRPIAYQPSDYQRWGLVAKIDVAEAYQPVRNLAWILFLSETALLLVGLLVSRRLARRLARPIHNLTETASVVASGDLTARATVSSQDEVGALAVAFNRMAAQVAASHATLEQHVAERTAELTREITEHKRTQEHLRAARDAAEEANRAKSDFLANMSHEIRTPMNGIIGMAELLATTETTREQAEYLVMIQQSADALLRLLNDILDFSKIEAGKLELESIRFSLRDCVGMTAKTLSLRAAEKGLELACRVAPELPDTLVGDPGRLRQIIVNLAGNAVKFTNEGEVVIDVVESSRDDKKICLQFSVRDTGIGIPADKLDKLFEPFTQVDASTTRKFGGTGLGLAISMQLAEMMDGRIWLESELGRGTTFHFTAQFGIAKRQPRRPVGIFQRLAGMPALVVDDNATNRRILEEALKSWQMKPAVVASGPEALVEMKRAAQDGAPYQLVLLDCMMPEMDGFMLAERIGQQTDFGDPAMIMVSSAVRPGDADKCRQLGIARYLTKPVMTSELLDAVAEALAFKSGRPEVAASEPPDTTAERGPRLKILLAEDGLINQRVAVGLLEQAGHEVVVANNGQEAVDQFARQTFDAVLMDVQMPVMDGFEATQVIREEEIQSGRHTPIIAMTAAAMKGDRENCLAAGMDNYLAKPIDPDELARALAELTPQSCPAAAETEATETKQPAVAAEPALEQAAPAVTHEPAPSHDGDGAGDLSNLFNLDAALARVGGDVGSVRELARLLREEGPQMLQEVRAGLDEQDARRVQRGAHTIKGSAGIFAAERVVAAALRVENLGREEKLSDAEQAFSDLRQEVERLCAAVAPLADGDRQ